MNECTLSDGNSTNTKYQKSDEIRMVYSNSRSDSLVVRSRSESPDISICSH